jgi:hypothetical protein
VTTIKYAYVSGRSSGVNLSAAMDFDRPVRVMPDGTVADAPEGVWAPEVVAVGGKDPDVAELRRQGWELLRGYTGQYSYSGSVMHPSEVIGGQLEADILAEPGVYVAVVVWDEEGDGVGWAVARRVDP